MTERIVIDTNVLIVANKRDDTPSDPKCEKACIELLLEATEERKTVLLDTSELIIDEYEAYCRYSREPGVGDKFFKFLYNHQHSTEKVIHISIQETPDEDGGFANLPANTFDRDDRKFLAVAEAGDGRVMNATDSDWSEHAGFIASLGVRVLELCPQCLK